LGRKLVLFGLWLVGYTLGFVVYLFRKPFADFILFLIPSLSQELVGAIVSGLGGSVIMISAVVLWSYLST